jgi:general bacterial porin, GBP family
MKKTLLALAAVAASSAAFAQSTVTLFGVVDASVESVKGDKSVTRVSSDNLSSSRFGLKGSEDLGGGTKANFMLDSGLKVDTGANGGSTQRFFDRSAWVGLAGSFGEVKLGRIDSLIGDIAGNVLSAQAYDDLKIVKTRAGDSYRRVDNAITYTLPTFVPGLTASVQYSTATGKGSANPGVEVAGSSEGKAYGVSIKYAAGPLSAGIGYLNAKDETAGGSPSDKANATLMYAGYDFTVAKVTAYYDTETDLSAAQPNARRLTVVGAKVAVPFSPEFTLVTGLSTTRNANSSVAGDDNVQIVTIKGIYTLSKRTSVYGMLTNVNNDTNTKFDLGATASNDKTTRGLAVGVRHMF